MVFLREPEQLADEAGPMAHSPASPAASQGEPRGRAAEAIRWRDANITHSSKQCNLHSSQSRSSGGKWHRLDWWRAGTLLKTGLLHNSVFVVCFSRVEQTVDKS